jgi:hypothetical protein
MLFGDGFWHKYKTALDSTMPSRTKSTSHEVLDTHRGDAVSEALERTDVVENA